MAQIFELFYDLQAALQKQLICWKLGGREGGVR
jgi:hypothetical protein